MKSFNYSIISFNHVPFSVTRFFPSRTSSKSKNQACDSHLVQEEEQAIQVDVEDEQDEVKPEVNLFDKRVGIENCGADEDREFGKEDAEGSEVAEEEAAEAVFPTDCGADELSDQFDKRVGIGAENVDPQSADTDGFVSSDADTVPQEQGFKARAEDDEASILESMVSGQKNRNKVGSKRNPNLVAQTVQLDIDNDEVDYMEYNNVKGSRRKKGVRRQRGRMPEEVKQAGFVDKNGLAEENTGPDDSSEIHEQSCDSLPELRIASGEDDKSEKVTKLPKDVTKNTSKQDSRLKSKETAKGKKKKPSTKVQSNACEKCGEEFETRNKLHKHLGDTGHATLKSR